MAVDTWERSFAEQVERHAYNTAPVEALVRNVSYYLRTHEAKTVLEIGCGAGANLRWCMDQGLEATGVDISPTALSLAADTGARLDLAPPELIEASATDIPLEGPYDIILEACVFQHLNAEEREKAFAEVDRLTKPGGLFCGYMLERGHSVYQGSSRESEPGTVELRDGRSDLYLTNIGLAHFFTAEEIRGYLADWQEVDPCLLTYELPRSEARRRGYRHYLQSMLAVYAVK